MRLDDAGPRTWLLAGAAGWALALWLLALAGMGGRISVLPDDPALAQPLPRPAPPAPGRLGSLADYRAIGARPLLSPTRQPQPFSLVPEREGAAVEERFEYVLTGVLLTPALRMAILQPAGGGESLRLRVGEAPDQAPSWRLAGVSPRAAVFQGPDGERTLELRSYDGGADIRPAMPVRNEDRPRARRAARAGRPVAAMPVPATPVQAEGVDDGSAPVEPEAVEDADAPTPAAQMEAIRKRIEARRAQLRREARQPPPAEPPPPQQR